MASEEPYSCILCRACLCEPLDETLISYQGPNGEGPFIDTDQVYWLAKYRIIGQPTTDDGRPTSTFLTGPVRLGDWGGYRFLRGSAKGVEFGRAREVLKGTGSKELLLVEGIDDGQNLLIRRIHERCCMVLWRFLTFKNVTSRPFSDIDTVIAENPEVFLALDTHYTDNEAKSCGAEFDMDVKFRGTRPETTAEKIAWHAVPKDYVCDPCPDGWLSSLLITGVGLYPQTDLLHTSTRLAKASIATSRQQESRYDRLALFPIEVIEIVATFLDTRHIRILCEASKFAAQALNSSSFWRSRIANEMPWIWEAKDSQGLPQMMDNFATSVSWLDLHYRLLNASTYQSSMHVLGMVNRRRIWGMCETLDIESSNRSLRG